MPAFTVTVDAASAQQAFSYVADRAADLMPAMDAIGRLLLSANAIRAERRSVLTA